MLNADLVTVCSNFFVNAVGKGAGRKNFQGSKGTTEKQTKI